MKNILQGCHLEFHEGDEYVIKIYLRKIACSNVNWIEMAQIGRMTEFYVCDFETLGYISCVCETYR
jgi:hypothetical protein